jgi:RNA polymerase sigma factor (sigma-70 family)
MTRSSAYLTTSVIPPPPAWACVTREQFAEVLARLSPELRAVFELHAVRGQPYGEIAARLGISKNVVAARLYQARLLLKEALVSLTRERERAG